MRLPLALAVFAFSGYAHTAVVEIDPLTLSAPFIANFEEYTLAPGTDSSPTKLNQDGIVESGFTSFGERFNGQSVSDVAGFDVISGTPNNPLSLETGLANQNLTIGNVFGNHGISGEDAGTNFGEGSVAVLFDFDQSQIGFSVLGADLIAGTSTAGDLFVDFYARNGASIGSFTLTLDPVGFQSFAFATDDSSFNIAGFTLTNDDISGLGYDNFYFDVEGVSGEPSTAVPLPGSLFLFLSGLAALRAAKLK